MIRTEDGVIELGHAVQLRGIGDELSMTDGSLVLHDTSENALPDKARGHSTRDRPLAPLGTSVFSSDSPPLRRVQPPSLQHPPLSF